MTGLWRVGLALVFLCALAAGAASQPLPELTDTVNDVAGIVDRQHRAAIDEVIRALKAASGDVIVVTTVPTVAPYSDVREYAVKLFENHGRGVGDKGKDNGLLVLVAIQERRVWIEVGYGLEPWITDGFAGETARDAMTPEFRSGRYGAGLLAGVTRLAARIAEGRQVQLRGVAPLRTTHPRRVQIPLSAIIVVFILIVVLSRISGGPGRPVSRWGRRGWSGWSGGVGPFGGGGGGGFGGGSGGFGGGFGGFGGGRSGGGGGGGGW